MRLFSFSGGRIRLAYSAFGRTVRIFRILNMLVAVRFHQLVAAIQSSRIEPQDPADFRSFRPAETQRGEHSAYCLIGDLDPFSALFQYLIRFGAQA